MDELQILAECTQSTRRIYSWLLVIKHQQSYFLASKSRGKWKKARLTGNHEVKHLQENLVLHEVIPFKTSGISIQNISLSLSLALCLSLLFPLSLAVSYTNFSLKKTRQWMLRLHKPIFLKHHMLQCLLVIQIHYLGGTQLFIEIFRLIRTIYSLTQFVLVLVTQRKIFSVLHKEHLVKDRGLLNDQVLCTLRITDFNQHFISNVT